MKFNKLFDYIKQNHQKFLNIYLAVNVAVWIGWQIYQLIKEGILNYVEVSFILQNIVLMIFFLIRKPHQGIDRKIFNQMIAIAAFCSGLAFMGQPATTNLTLVAVSKYIIIFSNILGFISLLNLGRSFGVLIAFREVKTKGLYSIVRHPMYSTDILLRIGYVVSHFNLFTSIVFILSIGCYAYRAILEEKFLSQQETYLQFKKKVKYRFLPFIF